MLVYFSSIFILIIYIGLGDCQNPCQSNPCGNNGICLVQNAFIFRCNCQVGYTGTFCELPVNCLCQNGGKCIYSFLFFQYTCECPPDRSGQFCEKVNPCFFGPCKNGATCTVNSNNDPVCTCLPGFTGQYCNIKFGPNGCVNNNVCQNGGTCFSELTFFGRVNEFCKCPANFFGQFCEIRLTNNLCVAPDSNFLLCSTWFLLGYCDFKYNFGFVPVPITCPSSCSLCKNLASCQDSQLNCNLWAALGLCSRVSEIDSNLCRKSCQLCPFNIF